MIFEILGIFEKKVKDFRKSKEKIEIAFCDEQRSHYCNYSTQRKNWDIPNGTETPTPTH